ncbi:MAG TPA: ChbG/HpnK family deacetylase [Gammaproteobacteria bacterium]|nr:ChbG/HpnK family deacetylase [Gammaproteobacteria bacterium]
MNGGARVRLIVHADDFGISESVNQGIVDAHRRGIVTSTSVMANGAAFEHAVALAKECPTLDVGVHLTLTEERPVGGAAAGLVDANGRFTPHALQFAARYAAGRIPLRAVRAELDAQIRRVLASGLPVSHLDGHQHVHVLPGIAGVVAELARAHGIRTVRYPAERVRGYMLRNLAGARRLAEQIALGVFCALSPLRELRRIDEFVGFYFGGRLDEANLATVLEGLPPGRTAELMCHPGDDDPRGRYGHWRYSWAAERDALSSPRIRDLVLARGVQLISYRDL